MHTVTVKVFATLQLKVNFRKIVYEGPVLTASEMIDWLADRVHERGVDLDVRRELLDEDDSIIPGTILLIDGKNVHHIDGLESPVDGEVFSVFPPNGGG